MKINWNYFTKQKGIVIISLVMCLVILGSANYIYTRSQNNVPDIPTNKELTDTPSDNTDNVSSNENSDQPTNSNADYFESYRVNRQSIRDLEMRYVQTVADNDKSDAAIKKEAEARLVEIASLMETELKIENLIKAKGFDDVVAFVEEGAINIVVKAETLSSSQATKILKVVVDETGEQSQNVTIITRT